MLTITRESDSGRPFEVSVLHKGTLLIAELSREFLDDKAGDASNSTRRKEYIMGDAENISRAVVALATNGYMDKSYIQIHLISNGS